MKNLLKGLSALLILVVLNVIANVGESYIEGFRYRVIQVVALATMFGMIFIAILSVYNESEDKKRAERNRQRELARQVKLQEKIDAFGEFKHVIDTFDISCNSCYEFDTRQYLECHENDYNGIHRKSRPFDLKIPCKLIGEHDNRSYQEAYQESSNVISNLRVTLQDFTVAEVMGLYSF